MVQKYLVGFACVGALATTVFGQEGFEQPTPPPPQTEEADGPHVYLRLGVYREGEGTWEGGGQINGFAKIPLKQGKSIHLKRWWVIVDKDGKPVPKQAVVTQGGRKVNNRRGVYAFKIPLRRRVMKWEATYVDVPEGSHPTFRFEWCGRPYIERLYGYDGEYFHFHQFGNILQELSTSAYERHRRARELGLTDEK